MATVDTTTDIADPDIVVPHFYNCKEMTDLGHNNIIYAGEPNIIYTNNYFNKLESLGEDVITETCLTGLEAVAGLDMISQFSVYQRDVERRGEQVLDGSSIRTGPIKDLPCKEILYERQEASNASHRPLDLPIIGDIEVLYKHCSNSEEEENQVHY